MSDELPEYIHAPKVKRLLEIMGCDDLDEAILQAEADVKESLEAAAFIKKAKGLPENEWPSPHDRSLYIALRKAMDKPDAANMTTDEKLPPPSPELLCRCGNPALPLHMCPFQFEECNCCQACSHDCEMGV